VTESARRIPPFRQRYALDRSRTSHLTRLELALAVYSRNRV